MDTPPYCIITPPYCIILVQKAPQIGSQQRCGCSDCSKFKRCVSSETLEMLSGALQGKNQVCQIHLLMSSLNITESEACWVSIHFSLQEASTILLLIHPSAVTGVGGWALKQERFMNHCSKFIYFFFFKSHTWFVCISSKLEDLTGGWNPLKQVSHGVGGVWIFLFFWKLWLLGPETWPI